MGFIHDRELTGTSDLSVCSLVTRGRSGRVFTGSQQLRAPGGQEAWCSPFIWSGSRGTRGSVPTEEARVPAVDLGWGLPGTKGGREPCGSFLVPRGPAGVGSEGGRGRSRRRMSVLPRHQGPGTAGGGGGRGRPHVHGRLPADGIDSLGPQLIRCQQRPQGCYRLVEKGFTQTTKTRFTPPAPGPRLYGSPVPVGRGEWEALARGLEVGSGRSAALGSPPGSDRAGWRVRGPGNRAIRGAWPGLEGAGSAAQALPTLGAGLWPGRPHRPALGDGEPGWLPAQSQFRGNPRPTRLLQSLQGPPISLPLPAEGSHGALLPRADSSGTSGPAPDT